MMEQLQAPAGAKDRWFEAVDWHTRFDDVGDAELSAHEVQRWQAWLADDENRLVFDQVTRLMGEGPRYRKRDLPSREAVDADPYDASEPLEVPAMAPDDWPPLRTATRHVRPVRWLQRVVIAASVIVAVTVAMRVQVSPSFWNRTFSSTQPQIYEAPLAAIRTLTLQDGSRVILGAQSTVTVQFTPGHRLLRLQNGEAWFKVAPDAHRPFTVTVASRAITALGTAFVIRNNEERTVVTVLEGNVEVASPPASSAVSSEPVSQRAPGPTTTRLSSGEQMIFNETGAPSLIEHADTEAEIGWSKGRLDFDHQPLRAVVGVLSRYSHRVIRVDSPSGDQLFTGIVLQDQIDEWILRLADIYPVEVSERDSTVCVHARGEPRTAGTADCRVIQ